MTFALPLKTEIMANSERNRSISDSHVGIFSQISVMQNNNRPDTSYIKKMRREFVSWPLLDKERFKNVYLLRYAGSKKEMNLLADMLEKNLAHKEIIGSLRRKLEKEDIPANIKLSNAIQKFIRVLSTGSNDVPYTVAYYDKLLRSLKLFLVLLSESRQTKYQLLNKLKTFLYNDAGKAGTRGIYSEEIDDFVGINEEQLDNLQKNYDVFNIFLEQELHDSERSNKTVRVTSRIEEHLSRLIDLIEKSILASGSVTDSLFMLRRRLTRSESQGIYN